MAEPNTAVKPEQAAPAAPEAEPGLSPASPDGPLGPEAVGSEASPPEGAEQEPPASWWAGVADEDGLRGHEKVTAWVSEAREEGLASARSEMQPRLDARNSRLGQLQKDLGTFWQSFDALNTRISEGAAEDGGEQLKEFNELLKHHQPSLAALGNLHYGTGYREAFLGRTYQGDSGEPVRELGVVEALFGSREAADHFVQRVQNTFEFGTRDPDFYSDLRKALTKTEVEAALAQERPKMEKDVREQVEEEARARQREENGNPPVPAGGGGGGGRLTAKQLDKMTPQQVAEQDQGEVDRVLAGGP